MQVAILIGVKPDGSADVLDLGPPSQVRPKIKEAQYLPGYREVAYYTRPERTTRSVVRNVDPIAAYVSDTINDGPQDQDPKTQGPQATAPADQNHKPQGKRR